MNIFAKGKTTLKVRVIRADETVELYDFDSLQYKFKQLLKELMKLWMRFLHKISH